MVKIYIYCNIALFIGSWLYREDGKCQYFTINVYFHNVESILEHRFLYNICSLLHSLRNEPTCKALWQFDFFMYNKYGVFRACQCKIVKCVTGGTNLHTFCWNMAYEFLLTCIMGVLKATMQLKNIWILKHPIMHVRYRNTWHSANKPS